MNNGGNNKVRELKTSGEKVHIDAPSMYQCSDMRTGRKEPFGEIELNDVCLGINQVNIDSHEEMEVDQCHL